MVERVDGVIWYLFLVFYIFHLVTLAKCVSQKEQILSHLILCLIDGEGSSELDLYLMREQLNFYPLERRA
jgi:hypothetical protein